MSCSEIIVAIVTPVLTAVLTIAGWAVTNCQAKKFRGEEIRMKHYERLFQEVNDVIKKSVKFTNLVDRTFGVAERNIMMRGRNKGASEEWANNLGELAKAYEDMVFPSLECTRFLA